MKQYLRLFFIVIFLELNFGFASATVDNLTIDTSDPIRLTKTGFATGVYGANSSLYSTGTNSWVKWQPVSGDLAPGSKYELFICSVTRQLQHGNWDLNATVEFVVNGTTYTKYLNQKFGVLKNTAVEAAAVTAGPANPTDNVADYIMVSLGSYTVSGNGSEYIKIIPSGGGKYTMAYSTNFVATPKNLLASMAVTNGVLDSVFTPTTYLNSIHPSANSVSVALTTNDPSSVLTVGSQTGIGSLNLTVDNTNAMWESGIPIKSDYTSATSQNYLLRVLSSSNYIINNENLFEYAETGSWTSSGLAGYYSTSRYTTSATATAAWKPKKIAAGVHQVYFYNILRSGSTGETAAKFTISSNGGKNSDIVIVNQNQPTGFVDLGSYYFEGSDLEFVQVGKSASSSLYLQVDALKFVKQNITEVQAAALKISLGSSTLITSNITLPTVGDFGTTISWSSDVPTVITNAGIVTRPTNSDQTVTLTATVSKNSESTTRMFTLKVPKYFELPSIALNQVITDNTAASLVNNQLQITVSKNPAIYPGFRVYASNSYWNLNNYERVGIEIQNTGTVPVTLSCWAVSNGWGGVGAYGIDGSSSSTATAVINPQQTSIQYIYIHSKFKDAENKYLYKMIDPEMIHYFDIKFATNASLLGSIQVNRIFAEMDVTSGSYDKTGRLLVPQMTTEAPAAGKYVKQQLPGFADTQIYHSLYLPTNWVAGKKYPVIIEYAPNVYYNAACYSTGKVEDVMNGFGMSKGVDYIWASLPYISADNTYNETNSWGSPDSTVQYAMKAIRNICENYGGDPAGVFVTGFSRGAIAAGYIALRNDEIADTWLGFNAAQHTDGDGWGASNVDSALRISRLKMRPVFLIDNGGYPWTKMVPAVGAPLQSGTSGIGAHTSANYLDDRQSTADLRAWMAATYLNKPGTFKISGNIKDSNGIPLANVLVETGRTHFTYTDSNGNYLLAGLITGDRTVTYKNNNVLLLSKSLSLTADQTINLPANNNYTGLIDSELNNPVIYPTRVKNELHINLNDEIVQIKIVNVNGLNVFEKKGNYKTINTEALKEGLYFVNVKTENRNLVERFIKE